MTTDTIDKTMQGYVDNNEMAGGSLLVRSKDTVLYREKWGDVEFDSIYRMMSMTKCITAVAVMICVERGLIDLDDSLSLYIPEFKDMSVVDDSRYAFDSKKMKKLPFLLLSFNMDKLKKRPAKREITIRDLLSHSSGLQQGLVGLLAMMKEKCSYDTLRDYVHHFSKHSLDFDPGNGTGYSPLAGFDILGYVVSIVSGMSLEEFIKKEICIPLEMKDTTFFLSRDQEKRLVDLYLKKGGKLKKVTDTKHDMAGFFHEKQLNFEHGCGGIYSTLDDYSNFGEMLLCDGSFRGKQILRKETVDMIHSEGPHKHMEPEPGFVWGLGMKIRQDKSRTNTAASEGTYGWSGAFGTHFLISPKDDLEVVFMMNRSDIGGSGSYIIKRVEEMVFGVWGKQ